MSKSQDIFIREVLPLMEELEPEIRLALGVSSSSSNDEEFDTYFSQHEFEYVAMDSGTNSYNPARRRILTRAPVRNNRVKSTAGSRCAEYCYVA